MLRCDYQITAIKPDSLTIQDLNLGRMSVTNDVENVVKDLFARELLKPGMQLFYYDSDGDMDEICFDASGFTRFKCVFP